MLNGNHRPAVQVWGSETATVLHDLDDLIAKPPAEMEAVRGVMEPFWD